MFTREQRVGTRFVDGANLLTKTAYEFNGCIFHGCPKCYPDPATPAPRHPGKTTGDLFKEWSEKEEYLKSLGFSVDVKWECELREDSKTDRELDDFIKARMEYYRRLNEVGIIKPRDALFGGRTNNIKFHLRVDGITSEIKYVDFTSLYPYEVSRRSYPIGQPRIVRQNFDYRMSYVGISKCKVLPPNRLRFGVLPVRVGERLVFPLCRTCADTCNQSSCTHNQEERCFIGTWATPELRYAIDRGYKIIEVFEELKFDEERNGIFSDYIKLWMKEKQESSGWPDWCKGDDGQYDSSKKQEYIRLYKEHEDIELDSAKIEKNPGRRFIAKLMLNSFWGKFAQRTNMGQTAIITKPEEYFQIIEDPTKEICCDEMLNEETMFVGWKYVDDCWAHQGNTNTIIAAFVTCYARLELLAKLEEIESVRPGRVLYFDTDSIIFEHRSGDRAVATGDYLGELTDEVAKDYGTEAKCIEFVSGGPKNYATKIRLPNGSEKVSIKAKGITLNQETEERITFSEMKRLVVLYIDPENLRHQEEIVVDQFQINANLKKLSVTSRYFSKIYRVVSEKRRIVGNDTLPFGYVDRDPDDQI
jgi:hypothetical protein